MDSNAKPFWMSKTVVVNLVALVASALSAAGVADLGVEAQGSLVGIIMAVANIALRFTTKSAVSMGK